MSKEVREQFQTDPARWVEEEVKAFTGKSPLGNMPPFRDYRIFGEPVVSFADGDDPIFTKFKTAIAPTHLTPREAMAEALNKRPEELPAHLSVISWVLPVSEKTRESMRSQTTVPSRQWVNTRWSGEIINLALRTHLVDIITGMGHLA
ncbi:hypothetical protein ACFLU1_05065, partial [Chloroflexota bacterium]